MTASDGLGADRIMHVHGGQDADDGDVPGSGEDGWDLFGSQGLEGLSGLIGDGRDARYARGVDYTAAVRSAKSGERWVSRALRRLLWPGTRMATQSWSTKQGEPVVRVEMEMTPEMWCRWVSRIEDAQRHMRQLAEQPLTLRDVLRHQRRDGSMTPAMRRAWVRCPVTGTTLVARGGQREG
jgi:hypothetical protein